MKTDANVFVMSNAIRGMSALKKSERSSKVIPLLCLFVGDALRQYLVGPQGPPGPPGASALGAYSVEDLASRVVAYIKGE